MGGGGEGGDDGGMGMPATVTTAPWGTPWKGISVALAKVWPCQTPTLRDTSDPSPLYPVAA